MSGCRIAVVAGGLKQTVGSFLRRWSKLVRAAGCVLALLLGNSGVAQATPWVTGDVVTYYQDQWGEPTTAAGVILNQYMATVLPNGIEIGIPGNGGFSLILTDQFAVYAYLPQLGIEGVLNADQIDPTTSSSGAFGGDTLALALNVAFADKGLLGATESVPFGDLKLYGLFDTPDLNGMSVRDVLGFADTLLGGGASEYNVDLTSELIAEVADAFSDGGVSSFALQHIALPDDTSINGGNGATQTVPEPPSLLLFGFSVLGMPWIARNRRQITEES